MNDQTYEWIDDSFREYTWFIREILKPMTSSSVELLSSVSQNELLSVTT